MGKITLITGSENSGKSRWAVSCFDCCNNIQYLCTSPKLDKSTMDRIVYNESSHNVCWDLRCNFRFDAPPDDLSDYDNFIIDSISDLAARIFYYDLQILGFSEIYKIDERTEQFIIQAMEFVRKIKTSGGNAVVITNEAGFLQNMKDSEMAVYKKVLCTLNQRLVALADEVYFSVSGIQFKIK